MELQENVKCDLCNQYIPRGIINMVNHWSEAHNGKAFTNALIQEYTKKHKLTHERVTEIRHEWENTQRK